MNSVLLPTYGTLCLYFFGEKGVAMTKSISTSFSGAISVIETKIAALEKASNLAAEALEVRLHSMNEFRTQLKDQAASFVRREEHEHAQLSRQVHNISAFTPDRSPNLGLVRVLERAIKEAKADLRPSDWE